MLYLFKLNEITILNSEKKEFKGRWYLLAHVPVRQGLRCFELYRIRALELTTRSFDPLADFQADTYYTHSFGIIRPDHEPPAEIVLALEPTQGQYLKSHLLHASQRVLVDIAEELAANSAHRLQYA